MTSIFKRSTLLYKALPTKRINVWYMFRYIELIRMVNVDRYTMHWSGQFSPRPHTTDFPQKVAFWKGNGTPYFTKNLGWWNIIPFGQNWSYGNGMLMLFVFMSHVSKTCPAVFFRHVARHLWVFRTGGGSAWKSSHYISSEEKIAGYTSSEQTNSSWLVVWNIFLCSSLVGDMIQFD